MRLKNSFEVPAPPEAAWELLMDMPRVIPCMPGAKLDETVDDSNWKATVQVKLGPISLSFATDVKREEADEAARRTTLSARAREQRGRGAAQATIESSLAAMDGGTKVDLVTDLSLTGAVAQYGRGIVGDVSSQLVKSFAECLQAQLSPAPAQAQAQAATEAQGEPVRGLSLGLGAVGRSIGRFFGRLFGRR
jgi:carbon monoxide dehydrogenase subunit G